MVRSLPPGRALAIRGSMAPVVATLPMAWRDRLYRKARRHGYAIANCPPFRLSPRSRRWSRRRRRLRVRPPRPKSESNGHGRLADVLPGPWGSE